MSFKKILTVSLALALPMVFAVPALVLAAAKGTYKVDPAVSTVQWLGKKVTGQHSGNVPVKSGEISVQGGNVTGGKVLVDLSNITVTDLDGEMKGKLEGHLKSDDFFSVEKHPTATFEIKSVKKLDKADANGQTHEVTGTLTIKDTTNPLTFPAKIAVGDNVVTATANGVAVDRTLYDIRYGSGKFFQGLGDKVIYDKFWLDFDITAKK